MPPAIAPVLRLLDALVAPSDALTVWVVMLPVGLVCTAEWYEEVRAVLSVTSSSLSSEVDVAAAAV